MADSLDYRPLRTDVDEIRVLELNPANTPSNPLSGRLRHVLLQQAEFDALSYVWGQQEQHRSNIRIKYKANSRKGFRQSLLCNQASTGFDISIGNSLSRALRCIRSKHGSVFIWTDMLCIDQDQSPENREKEQQVAMMKRIYARAKVIHAWLGPSLGEDEKVWHSFTLASTMAKRAQQGDFGDVPLSDNDWLQTCFAVAGNDAAIQGEMGDDYPRWEKFAALVRETAKNTAAFMSNLDCLVELSRVDYFKRIWILQETGRARSLVFHYHREQQSRWSILLLLSMAHSLRKATDIPREAQDKLKGFDSRFLAGLSARTTCSQERSVQDVLQAAYLSPPPSQAATDPRDLIYARLGLASDKAPDLNSVDVSYKVRATVVYTRTSQFLLEKGFTDFLVSFKPYPWLRAAPRDLPKHLRWLAKDWDSLPTWAYDWHTDGLHTFARYDAAKGTKPQITFMPCLVAEFGHTLRITGCHVGFIKYRGDKFSDLVVKAGMGPGEIEIGSLKTSNHSISPDEKDKLINDIHTAHRDLNIGLSEVQAQSFFRRSDIRVARFWRWWLFWTAELLNMTAHTTSRVNPLQQSGNLAELFFREASAGLDADVVAGVFGTTNDLNVLIDLGRWAQLLSPQDPKIHAVGVQLMETLFRSAWGMRIGVLDTGYLCYVPEGTNDGDEIVIFHGVKAPVVLRKKRDQTGIQSIVGPTHVRGAMQGELMRKALPVEHYTLL